MAIEFLLPLLANILQGGIANAIQAGQTSRLNNEQIRLARLRREELQPLIDQLRTARDFTGMEEQLVRDFSRASDQMAAQSAQTGTTNAGSGGLDQVRRDTLGGMIAQLAQTKMADDLQRKQMLAELLSDPSLYAGEHAMFNPGLDAALGGLGGALAGAGSTLSAFLATPDGIKILQGLGQSQGQAPGTLGVNMGIHPVAAASQSNPGVSNMASTPNLGDFMGFMSRAFFNPYRSGGSGSLGGGALTVQQLAP